jgi:diacylglycerol kinase (ATP)
MRALALLGPRALPKHLNEFRDSRCELTTLDTPSANELRRILESARPDIAVVFGGDGTLNRHLGPLSESGAPTIVVPTGSGNDLARATGTPNIADAKRVWQAFLNGSAGIMAVDLGCIALDGATPISYFSCCANVGLDADAARRAEGFPNWVKSRGGYFVGGLVAMALYQPLEMKVAGIGFTPIDDRAWFISVSNTPTFGGGLKIAPQASITDGHLDITFASSSKLTRSEIVRHFPKILAGDHVKLPELSIFRTSQLSIETAQPTVIYADGEYIGQTPCRILLKASALNVVQIQKSD